MKKILTLSIALILFSCSSSDDKAHENVSDYIKSKLDDPKSYESDSFGKLEPIKEELENNPEFIKLYDLYKSQSEHELSMYSSLLKSDSIRHPDTYKTTKEYYTSAKDSSEKVLAKLQSYRTSFKPSDMFAIKHRFRAKNKMGGLVLDSCTAYLDKEYNVKYLK